jgi:hypothetical protein
MFAFVILGSIISFAYTGVIQARRSALDAQQRTQATFIAQYQKNALNAYRSGLPWNGEGGNPNFLVGGGGGTTGVNGTDTFCMDLKATSGTPAVSNWIIEKETDPATNCTIPAGELYGGSGKKKITFAPYNAQGLLNPTNCTNVQLCSSLQATIVVSWQSTSGIENSVTNTVVLTQ